MSRFISIITAMFFVASTAWSGDYSVDPAHSQIGFEVTHMVIATVDGHFDDYTVNLSFNPDDLSAFSVEAVINTASITTERDNHLKSPDFFDVAKFPQMIFKSNKVEKTENGYVAKGSLTIRGVTKEVDLPFTIKGPIKDPWGNKRIGIEGETEINRQDFGVKWSKTMDGGGLVVSDEVQIKIDAEFVEQESASSK